VFGRRSLLKGAALAVGVGGLAGLGACSTGGAADGKVTLRVAWWGNATRNELTAKAIELFQTKYPDITIESESGEFTAYFERLATQVAAKDAPDVIQMDYSKIREFGGRGALLDLNGTALDTSNFLESSKSVGLLGDQRVAVNGAVTERVYLANPDVFAAAKVDLPDDSSWTWDEFAQIAAAVTQGTPEGTWGAPYHAVLSPNDLLAWLRQKGKDVFTEEGLGFEPADLAEFYSFGAELSRNGASPQAAQAVEDVSANAAQSLFWTGKGGLYPASSNQVVAISKATGTDLKILRYPTFTGKAADTKAYVTGLSWSVSATTKHSAEAVTFLNFILNDLEAGKILGDERGLPPNNEIRAEIAKGVTGAAAAAGEFIDRTASETTTPPVMPLVGGGDWSTVVGRHAQDVLFGKAAPLDAATAAHTELDGAVKK